MNERLVYKYVTADRIDVLKDARIRFTQPAALNDPFESLPCLTQYKQSVTKSLQEKATERFGNVPADQTEVLRHDLVNVILDDMPGIMGHLFAFLSVSQVADNLLMWSHYAASHTGFVISFDADHEYFAPGNPSREGLKEVQYSRERYIMPCSGLSGLSQEELEKANSQFLFTKSLDWQYEREMRMLALPRDATKTIHLDGQPEIYLFDFPTNAVRQVILGFKMEQQVKEEIAGVLDAQYPHAKLLQATVNAEAYAIDFETYSEFMQREERLRIVKDMFKHEVVFKDKNE